MLIKYQIFKKDRLIIQKYIGVFSVEHYMNFSLDIMPKIAPDSIDRVLIDFRETDFENLPDDFMDKVNKMTEIRRNINRNRVKRKDITHVFWVEKPDQTVIAQLFIQNFSELKYYFCSTSKNVLKILNLPNEIAGFEYAVGHLENSF